MSDLNYEEIRRLIITLNNSGISFHPPFDVPVMKKIKRTNPRGYKVFMQYIKATDDWKKSLSMMPKNKAKEVLAYLEKEMKE